MNKRHKLWIGAGDLIAGAAGFAGWLFTRPPDHSVAAAPAIAEEESRPRSRRSSHRSVQRPVIAIIGINDATETTDYIMPTGILRRADVAEC